MESILNSRSLTCRKSGKLGRGGNLPENLKYVECRQRIVKLGNLERDCKVSETIITCMWWQRPRNPQIRGASRKYWKSGKFELDKNLPEPIKNVPATRKYAKCRQSIGNQEKLERDDNVPETRKI